MNDRRPHVDNSSAPTLTVQCNYSVTTSETRGPEALTVCLVACQAKLGLYA